MTTYELSRESWQRPQGDVWACFELNAVDAPILRGIKSADKAYEWRQAGYADRFIVPFRIDHEPQAVEDEQDLFSISGVTV